MKKDQFNMGEETTVHLKINNDTSNSPAIKVAIFQKIQVSSPDYSKEFEDIKLYTKSFKEERVEKGELDQMRVLDIRMPDNWQQDENNQTMILPSFKGKMFQISHYARVRLDIPFTTDPFVLLPFKLVDGVIEPESQSQVYEDTTTTPVSSNSSNFASPFASPFDDK